MSRHFLTLFLIAACCFGCKSQEVTSPKSASLGSGLKKRVLLDAEPSYNDPNPYQPSKEVLREVEALLEKYLKTDDSWLHGQLDKYLGQYKGVRRGSRVFVQGTFFCPELVSPDWRKEPMVFFDGADTNFTFLVDVEKKEVTEFMTGGNYQSVELDNGQRIVVRRGCEGASNYNPLDYE